MAHSTQTSEIQFVAARMSSKESKDTGVPGRSIVFCAAKGSLDAPLSFSR